MRPPLLPLTLNHLLHWPLRHPRLIPKMSKALEVTLAATQTKALILKAPDINLAKLLVPKGVSLS